MKKLVVLTTAAVIAGGAVLAVRRSQMPPQLRRGPRLRASEARQRRYYNSLPAAEAEAWLRQRNNERKAVDLPALSFA